MNREEYKERMKSDESVDMPTAADVAGDIMSNVHTEYDVIDVLDTINLVEELIAHIASFKADKGLSLLENRSELLSLIEECIKAHLVCGGKTGRLLINRVDILDSSLD